MWVEVGRAGARARAGGTSLKCIKSTFIKSCLAPQCTLHPPPGNLTPSGIINPGRQGSSPNTIFSTTGTGIWERAMALLSSCVTLGQ